MDNGIYIAAARQMALFRDMEVTATNIANINTTGYRAEHMMFNKHLVDDRVGSKMSFSNDIDTYTNNSQGSIQVTDNQLDFAINGPGYFKVSTPLGERYTRVGSFQINDAGEMVTAEGHRVLDQNGQVIAFDGNVNEIVVGSSGVITIDGEEFTQIGIVEFENPQLLERLGSGLYSSSTTPIISETSALVQGALENSNVQGVTELTKMIKISRATASTAKYIEVMYDLQRRNTTTWTRQG